MTAVEEAPARDPFAKLPVEAAALMEVLPHRHPFVFLDRLTELEPGTRAVGIKNISISDPVFAGHFPGEPIYPGVMLIEVASHVAGLVMAGDSERRLTRGYMAQVKRFKFAKLVRPGDQVVITATKKAVQGPLGEFAVDLTVDGSSVAGGQIAIAFSQD